MPNRRTLLASAALAPVLASPLRVTSLALAQEATASAGQDAVETQLDVAYGEADGEELLLDIYTPWPATLPARR
jgi:hypothetical protein